MSPHNLLGTYMIIFEHEYDNIFFINSYVVYVYYYNIDKMKKRILPIPELPQVPPLSEFMNQSKCNVNSFYIYTLCNLLKLSSTLICLHYRCTKHTKYENIRL